MKRVEDVLCLLGKVTVMRFAKENIWSGLLEEGYRVLCLGLDIFLLLDHHLSCLF